MSVELAPDSAVGVPAWGLALKDELATGKSHARRTARVSDATLDICHGRESLWVVLMRPDLGGFALRTAHCPGGRLDVKSVSDEGGAIAIRANSSIGAFRVKVDTPNPDRPLVRATVWLTPSEDLLLPDWPRDLYPLNSDGNPTDTSGQVHAAQRGLCAGLVYFTLSEPSFGTLLYLQNFTLLNDYFKLTGTTPDGTVGGRWPELGYAMPTSEEKPLPAGREVVLSDAIAHWSVEMPENDRQCGRLFLDLVAGVYPHIDPPESLYHDWPKKAEDTLRDLESAPEATIRHYGHLYVHPYVAAEYPDSMVQLTVLTPLREFAAWKDEPCPLADKLRGGVGRFFDPKLGTIRRYLPNVGNDKNADEVDSWYLYHPLSNLGRLAKEGDAEARELFLGSLDYAIKVAHRFKYEWPIQFNIETLEVIKAERKPGEPGQSDAGGLYAYIMLQAWELTEQKRFLDEAKKAIAGLMGLGFTVEYQSNLSAWGANACLRLWRITGDEIYRDQSYVFLASFFHNTILWESDLGVAEHYPVFLGVTCLHDGAYMALYECFECCSAFHEYMSWAGEDLRESVRLLLTEYCKYTPSRAWFYYPKELPKGDIATTVRNGHIDRALAFPVEDIYVDGKPIGQVGQEIYGCGAAFAFTTHAYHRVPNVPFLLYCEYPIHEMEPRDVNCLSFRVRGAENFRCRARLIPQDGQRIPKVRARSFSAVEQAIEIMSTPEGHRELILPAATRIEIRWKD